MKKELKELFLEKYNIKDINIFDKEALSLIKSPFIFSDMDKHIRLFHDIYSEENKNKILYIVDTDVDGITSASLMYNYFYNIFPNKKIKLKVNEDKKHGIFLEYKEIQALNKGDALIVNDAGSNDVEKIEFLLKKGINVLITDHHEIEDNCIKKNKELLKKYPNYSIISPKLEDSECHMTGSGMAHKVITAFDEKYNYNLSENYFDLATVGIIADMESFDEEVLGYLKKGLNSINNLSLKSIIDFKLKHRDNFNASDISFYIAPIINSLFRVGNNKQRNFIAKCFCTEKMKFKEIDNGLDEVEMHDYGTELLDNLRTKQNKMISESLKESKTIIKDSIAICAISKKYKNLTGLIANKLTNTYKKPSIVVWKDDNDIAFGSARMFNDFNLKTFLNQTNLFDYCQGHEQAFGLSFPKENTKKIINLKIDFSNDDDTIKEDFEMDFQHLDKNLLQDISKYNQYYMRGFEAPLIKVNNISVSDYRIINSKNRAFFTADNCEFLFFANLEVEPKQIINEISVIGTVTYNADIDTYKFICKKIIIEK